MSLWFFFTSSLLISFIILNLNKISDSQTSLVDARRNPTNQVGRRLAAVFQVSIFLDGIADVRSFMAAIVHRHNLLTRKRYKNAAPSVALSDSIGIRNAAVINIGSLTFVKAGIYQLFQVFTRCVPKASKGRFRFRIRNILSSSYLIVFMFFPSLPRKSIPSITNIKSENVALVNTKIAIKAFDMNIHQCYSIIRNATTFKARVLKILSLV